VVQTSPGAPTANAILVLDGDQASALSIVRSLGRSGLKVDIASATEHPICASSRHTRTAIQYPDPLKEEREFIRWIETQIQRDAYTLIVPVTERTLVPLLHNRNEIDARRISMAPSEALEQVLDKARTVALAKSLGIAVPASVQVSHLGDLDRAEAALGYPMVIKPSRSVGHGNGSGVQLTVSYAQNRDELEKRVAHALNHGGVILQEYFRGDGVGIELIADHGEVRFAFQHRRLHEVPLTGGGSSLRCSEAIVPVLLDAARALIKALKWHCVAMVEFKYAPHTGQFRLMEINGRFWGSLPLAIAAGADFPRMLYELLCEGRIAERPPAREGVLCRQLGRDVDWTEHVLRRNAPASLVTIPGRKDVLRDWALVFSPRHHFDVQSLSDPWPGVVDFARIVRKQLQRVTGRLRDRFRLRQQMKRAHQSRQPWHTVLFLCYGNINRSALAHAYAAKRQKGSMALMSAGFHPQDGRPADPIMVSTAATRNIDLSQWRSHTLDAHMVASADLILAMEQAHVDRLLASYPQAADKVFLLGAANACAIDHVEIPDPYGLAPEIYQRVCDQVIHSVDAWLAPDHLTPNSGIGH
jgi:protein-tyrosine-phosphatase/carbamoylphosphate synthase large subunit